MLPINHNVPQCSVLGPLLFVIYINDLNGIVNFSKIHHSADTNTLYASNSLKDINRNISWDLKSMAEWLKANMLNSSKKALVLFRSSDKKITKSQNFGISGQKINIISNILILVKISRDKHKIIIWTCSEETIIFINVVINVVNVIKDVISVVV